MNPLSKSGKPSNTFLNVDDNKEKKNTRRHSSNTETNTNQATGETFKKKSRRVHPTTDANLKNVTVCIETPKSSLINMSMASQQLFPKGTELKINSLKAKEADEKRIAEKELRVQQKLQAEKEKITAKNDEKKALKQAIKKAIKEFEKNEKLQAEELQNPKTEAKFELKDTEQDKK